MTDPRPDPNDAENRSRAPGTTTRAHRTDEHSSGEFRTSGAIRPIRTGNAAWAWLAGAVAAVFIIAIVWVFGHASTQQAYDRNGPATTGTTTGSTALTGGNDRGAMNAPTLPNVQRAPPDMQAGQGGQAGQAGQAGR
ncbi:hypothetical protein A33M_1097 [Rhodovulum sp. PH10]|uniref:hypothetical protein n=1 Tax=Rhodovulum sp. PH10 TaxID=1187851 RepID=UPI00027C1F0E|nr:hypothetical protein [Rhodovulum sp. PH10]EJW09668.1 hypothetical protein A33M_1097 [Rhodovulum sp. PH10]